MIIISLTSLVDVVLERHYIESRYELVNEVVFYEPEFKITKIFRGSIPQIFLSLGLTMGP